MFGGAAAAVVLLAASPAFACLTQKGNLTLTPSGGSSFTVKGDSSSEMAWCPNPTSAPSIAKGGQVRVQVASATCNSTTTHLGNGTSGNTTYKIRLNSSTTSPQWVLSGGTWTFQSGTGCFASNPPPTGTIDLDTTYSVSSTGTGDETVTIPNDATVNVSDTNEAAGLCVGGSSLGSQGIFGPLRIT